MQLSMMYRNRKERIVKMQISQKNNKNKINHQRNEDALQKNHQNHPKLLIWLNWNLKKQ